MKLPEMFTNDYGMNLHKILEEIGQKAGATSLASSSNHSPFSTYRGLEKHLARYSMMLPHSRPHVTHVNNLAVHHECISPNE
jgi:hypothetical protein